MEAAFTIVVFLLGFSFVWGTAYAYVIAVMPRPPEGKLLWLDKFLVWFYAPGQTFVQVIVGDGLNDIQLGIALYVITGDWFVAVLPILFHISDGLPMSFGMLLKHKFLKKEATHLSKANGRTGRES